MNTEPSSTLGTVFQGGVTITAIAFLRSALTHMIPYAIIAVPLIALDLLWGIRAAKYRKERVTFSRAFRRTMNKTADYLCWIVIAASVAVAFEARWLEWLIIGAVMFNEIISVVANYFETKGIKLSIVSIYRLIFKKGAEKAGVEVSDEDVKEIIKPQRDARGRFIKKCGIIVEQEKLIEE